MVKGDVTKASLRAEHKEFIDLIIKEGYFKETAAAYNFFVSYALNQEIKATDKDLERSRESNVDDADREKFVDPLVSIKGLYIDDSLRNDIPVRIMNALADIGIQIAIDKFWSKDSKELDMEGLLL